MASNLWMKILQEGFANIPSPLSKGSWNRLYASFDQFADSIAGWKSIPPSDVAKWNCAGVSNSTR